MITRKKLHVLLFMFAAVAGQVAFQAAAEEPNDASPTVNEIDLRVKTRAVEALRTNISPLLKCILDVHTGNTPLGDFTVVSVLNTDETPIREADPMDHVTVLFTTPDNKQFQITFYDRETYKRDTDPANTPPTELVATFDTLSEGQHPLPLSGTTITSVMIDGRAQSVVWIDGPSGDKSKLYFSGLKLDVDGSIATLTERNGGTHALHELLRRLPEMDSLPRVPAINEAEDAGSRAVMKRQDNIIGCATLG